MRNKRLRRALFIAPFALIMAAAWWPFTKVRLGPETTYISAPLAEDGLPNYALAIIEQQRQGVTRENNGARLLWQAMGPANVKGEAFKLLCEELDVDPPQAPYLVRIDDKPFRQRVDDWIASQSLVAADGAEDDAEQTHPRVIADRVLDEIQCRPWTAEKLPPIAQWIEANEQALDLLVEAAGKPRFFSPPPNFLSDPQTPVAYMQISHSNASRDAVQVLMARAMLRVGQREYDLAWQDLRACWQFGAHFSAGPTILDKLFGFAIRRKAMRATLALLAVDDLPENLAQQILQEVNNQPSANMLSAVSGAERLSQLDMLLRLATGRLGGTGEEEIGFEEHLFAGDPNVILRIGNKWFDRLESAASIKNLADRRQALRQVAEDMDAASSNLKSKVVVGLFLRSKRSEAIGELFSALLVPHAISVNSAVDRDATNLTLTRIAAALALFHAQHGKYPETLSELSAKDLLPTIPNDPYTDRSFVYQLRDDGYLLYSLYENGVDDGGSDVDQPIVEGKWIATDGGYYSRDLDKSDLVIRLPRPAFEPLSPKDVDDDAH